MAARNKTKTETASSLRELGKEAMRKLGLKKVFVSPDEYVFLNEADARAYVGKDGSYETVTEETEVQKEIPVPEKVAGDKSLNEHTNIDETDGN